MRVIRELDPVTIDQIAAGEVVEKPVNAAKELIENAIDAGARHITVEIEDGGIRLLRVTDDGEGIASSEVRHAFGRHATSKITSIQDLMTLSSLGFRGEALSSIAAVSKTEMITKTADQLTGVRIIVEGGKETLFEEIGAPDGTTVVVRDLFYNTPARGKFLRKPQTEGAYVAELVEHLAIAHPGIAFRFINNRQDRFHTSGSGDIRENIYRIYGRDIAASILPVEAEADGVRLTGYLGEPSINRGSRSHELFYINGRYVKDRMLSMALEEGYREYVMQHKFPFAVLIFTLPADEIDVNVHPAKMEVRFHKSRAVASFLTETVHDALHGREMIPDALLSEKEDTNEGFSFAAENAAQRFGGGTEAEPFEKVRAQGQFLFAETDEAEPAGQQASLLAYGLRPEPVPMRDAHVEQPVEQRVLSDEGRKEYTILGQLFDTYWLIAYRDKLLMMDQHAAHEKVNYERMMTRIRNKATISQLVKPPVVIDLTPAESDMLKKYGEAFSRLGFELEDFGDRSVALRGVPVDLYGAANEKTMFLELLDALSEETDTARDPEAVTSCVADMACKASVKGNTRMSLAEVNALLDELLTLDNPYHCPHGRPTIVSMSRYEIDKRFKRVVD